jgi:cytochrome o ubiquinol oxidase operon protein cyoD
MMEKPRASQQEAGNWTVKAYITGFILSLSLTLTAWLLVHRHVSSHHLFLSDKVLIITILCLAIAQLIAQLVFFLHLGRESKPRWNLTVLSFALIVVLILVLGSLWIMYNLDYHHPSHSLTPTELNHSIIKDEGISK